MNANLADTPRETIDVSARASRAQSNAPYEGVSCSDSLASPSRADEPIWMPDMGFYHNWVKAAATAK